MSVIVALIGAVVYAFGSGTAFVIALDRGVKSDWYYFAIMSAGALAFAAAVLVR